MGSVYRDRFDDSRTSVSSARRDGGGYTTRTRYIVKEDDARSSIGRDHRFIPERSGERIEETRIVRREVEEPAREVRREEPRYTERELVIRRDRDDDTRSQYNYDTRREEPTVEKELIIRRTTEQEPRRDDTASIARYDDRPRGDVRVTETRYRDDYEVLPPARGIDDRDRDLQRYTRTSEYYSPPQPQTIVIRQEPIIIRERIRDDDYQIVRKSDIEDDRTVVRRDQPRGEEDFFYEKKTRERIDEPRRDEDDYYERRSRRRSVSPHDSVSQRGRDYSSDDSMVYVRKEVREESRDASPDRRKNLAAGVAAGIGAAELLRNHKKREGRETSHGIGRLGRDLGAGALGAVAAEGISRARSAHRSKSRRRSKDRRSRSRSRSRDRRSRSRTRRSRSRSRSASRSKLKTLGALGLGAAALAAAATVASKRLGKKEVEEPPRRSRSRRRRDDTLSELENDPTADDARNPKHRNKRIAEAGAAGAVVAGLIERARSKSRNRDQSKVRQALPVVAAGLGSAALAGLYEKNKAKKEAEVVQKEERRARSRSRSRARSDAYYDGPRDAAVSDPGLIEYGNGPMHGNNFGPDYYGRPAPVDNYYGSSNAVVPAAAAGAAGYAAQRGTRSRSRSLSRERHSRRSSHSSSGSPGRRHHSRRRSRDADNYGTAGAIGGSEYNRRKEEKRERKARRRKYPSCSRRECPLTTTGQEEEAAAYRGHDAYEDPYNPGAPYASTPDPYASQQGFYPQTSQFPPPPGAMPAQYNPQTAAAPIPGAPPYGSQNYPPPPAGPPPVINNYDAYASGANPYAPRGPENVSAAPNPAYGNPFTLATPNDQHQVQDGMSSSRHIRHSVCQDVNCTLQTC